MAANIVSMINSIDQRLTKIEQELDSISDKVAQVADNKIIMKRVFLTLNGILKHILAENSVIADNYLNVAALSSILDRIAEEYNDFCYHLVIELAIVLRCIVMSMRSDLNHLRQQPSGALIQSLNTRTLNVYNYIFHLKGHSDVIRNNIADSKIRSTNKSETSSTTNENTVLVH